MANWECPFCHAKFLVLGPVGLTPCCHRYIEPGWYGKGNEFYGEVSRAN